MTNIGQLFNSFSGYTSFMLSIPKLCILDDPDWDDPYTIFDDDLTLIWCDKDADCENLKFLASAPNNMKVWQLMKEIIALLKHMGWKL